MAFSRHGKSQLEKIEHLIKAVKLVLFDVTLLILFIATLIRVIRSELGW